MVGEGSARVGCPWDRFPQAGHFPFWPRHVAEGRQEAQPLPGENSGAEVTRLTGEALGLGFWDCLCFHLKGLQGRAPEPPHVSAFLQVDVSISWVRRLAMLGPRWAHPLSHREGPGVRPEQGAQPLLLGPGGETLGTGYCQRAVFELSISYSFVSFTCSLTV